MDTKNIKELIKQAKSTSLPEEVAMLLDDFEQFTDLYSQKERAPEDAAFKEALFLARDRFLASFNEISGSFGLTPETVQSYFENPNHFSAEQWQNMQTVKQEFQETQNTHHTRPRTAKTQKMRI